MAGSRPDAERSAAESRLHAALDHASGELARSAAARAEALEAAAAAARVAQRARARIVEARERSAELARAVERAAADARTARREIEDLHERLAQSEHAHSGTSLALDGLLASTSWRITAPLRAATTALRHLLPAAPRPAPVPEAAPPEPAIPQPDPYADWITRFEPQPLPHAGSGPAIAVLFPTADATEATAATLRSILAQHEADWALLVPDTQGARAATAALEHDRRLVRVPCAPELDRAGLLEALLEHAPSPWFTVLDAGETLAAGALQTLGATVAADPSAAAAYADEDEIDAEGRRNSPLLKPGWSPELLHAANYLGRPTVLSRDVVRAAGGFRDATGAAAEWDLHLRLARAAQHRVVHVPAILCHRPPGGPPGRPIGRHPDRPAPGTRAANEHRAALLDHWAALGRVGATVETQPDGTHRSAWPLRDPPLVSVIVPGLGDLPALRRCLRAVLDRTDYSPLEIVLAGTSPPDAPTTAFHAELRLLDRVRVVPADTECDTFAALDFGARAASGALLAFLHPESEVDDPAWLTELVRLATLPGVGVAAATVQDHDGTRRGSGLVPTTQAGLPRFQGACEAAWGGFGRPGQTRNWTAVAWDGALFRRDAFHQAGGFGESGHPARDALLCLRIGRLGHRVASTPFATIVRPGPWPEPPAIPPAPSSFDLFDDASVLATAALPRHVVLPPPIADRPIEDAAGAARWVIALLRCRADLRVRFPRALSEGPDGAFATWLSGGAGGAFALPDGLAAQLPAMWRADLAGRPRAAYAWRDDVRQAHPDGLMPSGMQDFLRYLMCDGRVEYGFEPEEALWFLLAAAERPAAELVRAYRFNVPWQRRHPLGLTVFGAPALAAWIAGRYGTGGTATWLDPDTWPDLPDSAAQLRLAYANHPAWQRRHPSAMDGTAEAAALLHDLADDSSGLDQAVRRWCATQLAAGLPERFAHPAVNVLGHFCYPSGLRVSAEAVSDALALAGVAVCRRDIRTRLEDSSGHTGVGGLEAGDITIVHTQPGDLFLKAFERADLAERAPRTFRIGYWYWELEEAPPAWAESARHADELWAATGFIAEALRKVTATPVQVLFPGVQVGRFTPRPREALGAPGREGGRFAFLFSFHMASVTERKNPLGLIRAFRRAFGPGEPVDLVLKTTSEPRHRAEMLALQAASSGANVTIIDQVFGPEDTLALMDACDAYVSLHRSEGLGLTMAEAMLLGKPVIATRYSGNLDFMDDRNSLLVDATLVPVGPGLPPYDAQGRWAEPSEAHAARLMRMLFEDRAAAAALGRAGQESAHASLSLRAAGDRMAARLRTIAAARAVRTAGR